MKNIENTTLELKDALILIDINCISALETGDIDQEDVLMIEGILRLFPKMLERFTNEELGDIMTSLLLVDNSTEELEASKKASQILETIIKKVK